MIKKYVILVSLMLLAVLMSGCVSSPSKNPSNSSIPATVPQNSVKYVELNMVDGSKVGGKYISETASFITIVPLYIIESGKMTRGNGVPTGIKIALITTIVPIEDPRDMVNTTISQQDAKEKADEAANAAWEAKNAAENAKIMSKQH